MSLGVQIGVSVVWLLGYLALSLLYHRRWDAAIREWLGRKLGATVVWSKVDSRTLLSGESDGPVRAWDAQSEGSLIRQARNAFAVRSVQVVVMIVLGAAPAVGLLLVQMALKFNPLVLLACAPAVIAIFALYYVGTYRKLGV